MASLHLRLVTIDLDRHWKAFWRWWRDGLLAWLPAGMRRWLAGSSRRLIVEITDGGGGVLARQEAGQAQELDRLDRASPDWDVVTAWFRSEKPRQLVLRFPAVQALTRIVSLPLAAEKNPRQVAGFEMDRLTPFAASQVYYDVTVVERQPEQRRLRIELTALPRVGVDQVLDQLRRRGLHPDVLDVVGGRPGLNLLPLEQRVQRDSWGQWLRAMMVTASLLLVLAAVLLPIWRQRSLLIETINKVAQVQQAANQSLTLRDQLDQTEESSRVLAQKKQTLPTRVDLLRELTVIIPDDTWVERLQIRGDTLQIIGQSAKASALVAIIEASHLFSGAGFLSPVTTDPRTGKERFVLSARIGKEP